jgi:hypothetical protein
MGMEGEIKLDSDQKAAETVGPRLGPTETATCTLCGKADDTVGHRLGWCHHDKMQGYYVKRHDHVVKTLAGSFLKG